MNANLNGLMGCLMLRLHCDRALEYRLGFGESSQYSLNSGYGNVIVYPEILSGWWFGIFSFFPYIGNVIIPTDSLWSLKVMGDPQVTDGCFNKSWSSIFLGWFGVLQFEETSTLYPKQLYIHIYIAYLVYIPNGFQINGLGSLLEYLSRLWRHDCGSYDHIRLCNTFGLTQQT